MADEPSQRAAYPDSESSLAPSAHGYQRRVVRTAGCWFAATHQKPTVFAEHHHAWVQIAVLLDGANCTIRWRQPDGRRTEIPLRGGHVWIVPSGVTHGADWLSHASLLTFHVATTWVRQLLERPLCHVSAEPLDRYLEAEPLIGDLTEFVCRKGHQTGVAHDRLLAHMGPALATQLLLTHFAPCSVRHPQQWQLPRTALADVRAYIDEHLAGELSLAALARIAGLSPSYFGQLFRAATGVPPMVFVIGCRVRKAKALLRTGNYTAVQVAQLTGFSDQQQMDYHFRQYLNNPPRAYQPQRRS